MTSAPVRVWTDVPLHRDSLALLNSCADLGGPGVPPTLAAAPPFDFAAADAAIVGTAARFDAAMFARAPRLQVIARTGIGFDNIDVAAATAAGICAVNTPDAPTESTAEFAVGLMFAVARRIAAADHASKSGRWERNGTLGFELAGKTLGLVGLGRIGRRVAEIARAIRMEILAFDPLAAPAVFRAAGVRPCVTLTDLLSCSQILSLHAPLGPDTRPIVGARELALLPRGAILINTARGPLVDEAAVLAALADGHLAGAGLDVWETEPVATDHPLARHPLVVATPHIAAYTDEGRRRSHVDAADHVLAVLRGEPPPTLLNPAVWPRRRGGD